MKFALLATVFCVLECMVGAVAFFVALDRVDLFGAWWKLALWPVVAMVLAAPMFLFLVGKWEGLW